MLSMQGSLRENPSQAKEYIIPNGDWFEIVSSPHYLAEIVTRPSSRYLLLLILLAKWYMMALLGIYHYRLEKLTGGISGSLRIIRLTGMLFFLVFTKWLKRERENTASPMLRAMLIIFMLFSVNEFTKAYNLKQLTA
ncbi:hypothetical protein Rs2_23818 [Raphanus sativus]|nr:hypothetical protein Rs2_23818 [Raphanus sativus]